MGGESSGGSGGANSGRVGPGRAKGKRGRGSTGPAGGSVGGNAGQGGGNSSSGQIRKREENQAALRRGAPNRFSNPGVNTTEGQGGIGRSRNQTSGRKRNVPANTVLTTALANTARKTLLGT